jgi:hypothetical protein
MHLSFQLQCTEIFNFRKQKSSSKCQEICNVNFVKKIPMIRIMYKQLDSHLFIFYAIRIRTITLIKWQMSFSLALKAIIV